jgi:hypothetical protein
MKKSSFLPSQRPRKLVLTSEVVRALLAKLSGGFITTTELCQSQDLAFRCLTEKPCP